MRRRRRLKREAYAADRVRPQIQSWRTALAPTVPGRPLAGWALRWAALRAVGGAVAGALTTVGWLFVAGGRNPAHSVLAGLIVSSFAAGFYRRGANFDDRPRA